MVILLLVSLAANLLLFGYVILLSMACQRAESDLASEQVWRYRDSAERKLPPSVPSTGRPSTQAEIDGWPHEGTPVHFTASDAKE